MIVLQTYQATDFVDNTNVKMEKLQYPIGKFTYGNSYTIAEIRENIAYLKAFPAILSEKVANLPDEILDKSYRPEGWTLRQVVHHLADSHINAYIRCKLLLTQDNPTINPYQEQKWAEMEDAKYLPVSVSLQLLTALHTRWALALENVPDSDFSRTYTHPQYGHIFELGEVMALYAWHCKHHLGHIMLVLAD